MSWWHGRGDKLNGDKRVQNVTDRFNQIFVVMMWRAFPRTIVRILNEKKKNHHIIVDAANIY